ncbi:30S ribosomal protein S12 methylthiotransferase RimO [Porphyromonas sp. COT-108 OH1349]|uniref:30S ribosomal protein S12 methylthiotransferase RimO n=1 Tax=Porphyromonas sp. COT-108 OH1349 TaxID=1537504 RepID=UPI00052E2351|nr:30S ribosomal protein S12 methylthiotransferase RimO [Porphyromonas sp. COT-108 OH1349]KGN69295.1 ribosomal protein S12 methylthiotransferase [Porphyromonas sp. COT-108 OH1349]
MRKNRVDIITLGCSKNLVDSELLMHHFITVGYQVFHDPERVCGEIVVINTCGFIGDAKEESIETILRMVEAKKQGAIGQLYVMGCLSERYREELKKEIPEVDAYYGKFDWKDLVGNLTKAFLVDASGLRKITTPQHYAYVKISEGCDRACSYCAIPLITGKHKSRSIDNIIKEVTSLTDSGVKEIQLIAQDLTYYGRDLYKRAALADLLRELCTIDRLEWIRLHYAYPTQFPLDILPVMAAEDKICNYLDIALQHASDNMLKIMRRGISRKETEALLSRIRQEVPGIHIRTTMMVGHPGETESDFEELLDFVAAQRFERMGAFAYSHEDDTYSWKHYKDDIPLKIKKDRLSKLMKLQEGIAFDNAQQKVGQQQKVIIDREDTEYYIGRTEFDSPDVDPEVLISKQGCLSVPLDIGQFYKADIVDTIGFDLIAEIRNKT